MNLAIVDDQKSEREQLSSILSEYARLRRERLQIMRFSSAEELLSAYRPHQYTVLFLDIYLTGITGIQAAESIRKTDPDTLIVFLTDSSDHMPEAFSLHAYDYLSKPMNPARIFRVMDDIISRYSGKNASPALTIISNRSQVRVPYSDIIAIRSDGNYLEITDRSGTVHRSRMTFSDVREQLSEDPRFLQILRGVLVNLDAVIRIQDGSCQLEGNLQLPINVRSSKKIIQIWQNYMFSRIRQEAMEGGFRS